MPISSSLAARLGCRVGEQFPQIKTHHPTDMAAQRKEPMSDNKEVQFQVLKLDVEALKGSMERVMAGTTEDHAKWVSFKQCATDHYALVHRYAALTGETLPCYDPSKLKGWADTVWPMQKQIFDGVYAELMRLHGRLANRAPEERPTGFDDLLHPSIRAAALRHYHAGDYRNAVLDAVTALFDLLRSKTGLAIDGDDLCNRAFSPNRPVLIFSELETESGLNDQRGFMDIFKGFYRGVRNPKAHSLIHDLDALKAAQHLVLASLLARRVDEATLAANEPSSA